MPVAGIIGGGGNVMSTNFTVTQLCKYLHVDQLHVREVDKSSLNFSSHRTDTLCLGHITTVTVFIWEFDCLTVRLMVGVICRRDVLALQNSFLM